MWMNYDFLSDGASLLCCEFCVNIPYFSRLSSYYLFHGSLVVASTTGQSQCIPRSCRSNRQIDEPGKVIRLVAATQYLVSWFIPMVSQFPDTYHVTCFASMRLFQNERRLKSRTELRWASFPKLTHRNLVYAKSPYFSVYIASWKQ